MIDKSVAFTIPEPDKGAVKNGIAHTIQLSAQFFSLRKLCFYGRHAESHLMPAALDKTRPTEVRVMSDRKSRVNEFQAIFFSRKVDE